MENEKKLENISALKTILMILVVLCHSCSFFTKKWFLPEYPKYDATYLGLFAEFLGTFHIQGFTMASGFLFYYLKSNYDKYRNRKESIKKRAKRLLIPYIFTCIFWVIPITAYLYKYSAYEIFYKYVLAYSPSQLWFLVMLFWVFAFFLFFSERIKISKKEFIVIYITTTVLGYVLSFFNFEYLQIAKGCKYILYFYLGGYIFFNQEKITLKQIVIMIMLTGVLYGITIFNSNVLFKYILLLLKPLISICETAIIYYLITFLLEKKSIKCKSKIYKALENNSFGIYLFHQQIIYFTIILFNGLVHPVIQVLLSFIISIIISILMSNVLKKSKVTKFMFGL